MPYGPREISAAILRQFYREWSAYGLRREIAQGISIPEAKIPISVRELRDSDISSLFENGANRRSRRERLEISRRIGLIAERIPTPYVAVDQIKDRACFLQWLIAPSSNRELNAIFKGRFPQLASDEALLEFAFTPERYRGNGIMPQAMALIAEQGVHFGARSVVTYVLRDNTPALKGCDKAGFQPFVVRNDRRYLAGLFTKRQFVRIEYSVKTAQGLPQVIGQSCPC
jgi:RimJ/RimL family protein N-acetyltransferase